MKHYLKTFSLALLLSGYMIVPHVLVAKYEPQPILVDPGSNFERNSGLGNSSPGDIAAEIVNWVLGLLAMLAILLIVLAGFLWMLARGNEEEVTKAKDILQGAFWGLLIILASYGITSYVFENLVNVTTK